MTDDMTPDQLAAQIARGAGGSRIRPRRHEGRRVLREALQFAAKGDDSALDELQFTGSDTEQAARRMLVAGFGKRARELNERMHGAADGLIGEVVDDLADEVVVPTHKDPHADVTDPRELAHLIQR